MLFAKIRYIEEKFNKSIDEENDFYHLILETSEDVDEYFEAYLPIHSDRAVNIWKSQATSWRPFSHMPRTPEHTMAWTAAEKIASDGDTKTMKITMPLFLDQMDRWQAQKYSTMKRMIREGSKIRMNAAGGYSTLTNTFRLTDDHIEYTGIKQLKSWLAGNNLTDHCNYPIIKTSKLILENDMELPRELYNWLEEKWGSGWNWSGNKDVTVIKEFYLKTRDLNYKEWFNFFDTAIKNGLTEIYTYTTLRDEEQVNQVKRMLNKVMKTHPDKKLEVHILLADEYAIDKFNFDNIAKNITLKTHSYQCQ